MASRSRSKPKPKSSSDSGGARFYHQARKSLPATGGVWGLREETAKRSRSPGVAASVVDYRQIHLSACVGMPMTVGAVSGTVHRAPDGQLYIEGANGLRYKIWTPGVNLPFSVGKWERCAVCRSTPYPFIWFCHQCAHLLHLCARCPATLGWEDYFCDSCKHKRARTGKCTADDDEEACDKHGERGDTDNENGDENNSENADQEDGGETSGKTDGGGQDGGLSLSTETQARLDAVKFHLSDIRVKKQGEEVQISYGIDFKESVRLVDDATLKNKLLQTLQRNGIGCSASEAADNLSRFWGALGMDKELLWNFVRVGLYRNRSPATAISRAFKSLGL